ncbi:MAG: GC-type dockerin domain-anchored protein [Planctomycetota bacterium]
MRVQMSIGRIAATCLALAGPAAAQSVILEELYREGTALTPNRTSTFPPTAGFSLAVDQRSVYEYTFTADLATETEYTSLVRFDLDGTLAIVDETELIDTADGAGFVPLAADNGDVVFSTLEGELPSVALAGVGLRRADGSTALLTEPGQTRPGQGQWGVALVNNIRDDHVLLLDRVQDGFAFDNDGYFMADISPGGQTRRIAAVGDLFDGGIVDAVGSAGIGPDGSAALIVFDLDGNSRLVEWTNDSAITTIARQGDIGPGGGTYSIFVGQPVWTPEGWVFSARLEGGTITDGIFLWDGSTINTLLDGELMVISAGDGTSNVLYLTLREGNRVVSVIDTAGKVTDVLDTSNLLDGFEVSLVGFGADAIENDQVVLGVSLRDVASPADPIVNVAYRALIPAINPCRADVNRDGSVDSSDFFAWVTAFLAESYPCNQNSDDVCNSSDFFAWVTVFIDGC